MLAKLLRFRFIYLIVVAVTFINSMFFLAIGIKHSIRGYMEIIQDTAERPGLEFLESLDLFMISLVFLIFSLGIMRIFTHYHVEEKSLPPWLRIDNFKDLKVLLWETILVTLVILSVTIVVRQNGMLTWNVLIIPAMIVTLSLSLYIMRKAH